MELQAWKNTAPRRDGSAATSASSSPGIADEVLALVNAAPTMAGVIFDGQSIVDPIPVRTPIQINHYPHPSFYQVTTGVKFLRFSNYLSRFVLGKQIDYSALQVVVGWINEILKGAPPGFESIIAQAEKLDGLVRLSSGWGFYDIWKAFLTDATPPCDGRPLEILESVSSHNENAGKRTLPEMHLGHCQPYLGLRNQAFQLAALCTLPTVLSRDEAKVVQDLEEKFQKVCWTRFSSVSIINVSFSFQLLPPLLPRPLRLLLRRTGSLG